MRESFLRLSFARLVLVTGILAIRAPGSTTLAQTMPERGESAPTKRFIPVLPPSRNEDSKRWRVTGDFVAGGSRTRCSVEVDVGEPVGQGTPMRIIASTCPTVPGR